MADERKIRELSQITGFAVDRETAHFAQLKAKSNRLRQLLADLDDHKFQPEIGPAQIAGADMKYQNWVTGRKQQLNNELALILAELETAKTKLRRAVGKNEVVRLLSTTKNYKS